MKRIQYIDFLRGAGCLLVLAQHCRILSHIILGFHMPLFFFISGLLLGFKGVRSELNIVAYIRKRFFRLIIPYLLFELISLIGTMIMERLSNTMGLNTGYHIELPYALSDILLCIETVRYYGITNRFWFLPCIFFSDVIFMLINGLIKKKHVKESSVSWAYLSIAIIFFLISYVESQLVHIRLPLTLDICLMSIGFIALGAASTKYIERFQKTNRLHNLLMTFLFSLGLLIFVQLNSEGVYMYRNSYGNYIYAIIGAVFGVLSFINFIFTVEKMLPKKFLQNLSDNSLSFYPLHLQVLFVFSVILRFLELRDTFWLLSIIKFVIVLPITIIGLKLIDRFFPILGGKYLSKQIEKISVNM